MGIIGLGHVLLAVAAVEGGLEGAARVDGPLGQALAGLGVFDGLHRLRARPTPLRPLLTVKTISQ